MQTTPEAKKPLVSKNHYRFLTILDKHSVKYEVSLTNEIIAIDAYWSALSQDWSVRQTNVTEFTDTELLNFLGY